MRIDLNADLGEGYGPWRMGDDEALLELVSSANIACGFHAGDPVIMDRTVATALERGVDVGAHVGFPDRQGFGRRPMRIEPDELACMVVYQLGALAGIARARGGRLAHMSFHGALGNLAAADAELARPLLEAVARFDPELVVLTSPSPAIERAAADCGLRVAISFLADRALDREGLLVPRRRPGAVIHEPRAVLDRVARLLEDGTVATVDGALLELRPHSILLHGDTPGAVGLARAIRARVERAGWTVTPLSTLLAAPAPTTSPPPPRPE